MKAMRPAAIHTFALLGISANAFALVIQPTFDSTVTNLPNAAQYEGAVNYAITQLENEIYDPIMLNINIVAAPGTSILGQSNFGLIGTFSYNQINTDLINDSKSAIDAIAVANLPTADPTGGGNFWLNTALAKALGVPSGNPASDG